MKLFTKSIDNKLFAQFPKGGSLEGQKVIAKIFNPYGRGRWYVMNSDPDDPDYLWGIVELFEGEPEVGGFSRSELENLKVGKFRLPLERDLYFDEVNASELYNGLLSDDRYEKGGSLKDTAQYVSNRNIQEIKLDINSQIKILKGKDILDGVYVKKTSIKSTKPNDYFERLIEFTNNFYGGLPEDELSVIKEEDVDRLSQAGFDFEDICIIYLNASSVYPKNIYNELDSGLISNRPESISSAIDEIISNAKKGVFEMGIKYPDFNWFDIVKKYKISKEGIEVKGNKRTYGNTLEQYVYTIFKGEKIVLNTISDKIRYVDGKLDDDDYYKKDAQSLNNFRGGYWGLVSSDKNILKDIAKMILRKKSGYLKNMEVLYNNLGGANGELISKSKIKFAKGGELEIGIKTEMKEHGMDKAEATKTAKDHLRENPRYYSIMKKVGLEDGGQLESFKKKSTWDDNYEKIENHIKNYVETNYPPYKHLSTNRSSTNYGNSWYIKFYPNGNPLLTKEVFVVRLSDHEVGMNRMLYEKQLRVRDTDSIKNIDERIDDFFIPKIPIYGDEKKTKIVEGSSIKRALYPMDEERAKYKVLNDCVRKNKKGECVLVLEVELNEKVVTGYTRPKWVYKNDN
jgi:hypothetical protein